MELYVLYEAGNHQPRIFLDINAAVEVLNNNANVQPVLHRHMLNTNTQEFEHIDFVELTDDETTDTTSDEDNENISVVSSDSG